MKSMFLTAFAAMALMAAGCEDSVYDEQADAIRDQAQIEADAVREGARQEAIWQEHNAEVSADQLRQTRPDYEADAVESLGEANADSIQQQAEIKADLIEAEGEEKAKQVEQLDD